MEAPKPTEFWGIEVKAGQSVKVDPNEEYDTLIHISQVALGKIKKGKPSEPVVLFLKVADQKFVIGTLIKDTIPQIAMHIFLDKEAELSHSSKNARVYFTGYKCISTDDISYSDISDSDQEPAPVTDDHEAQAAEVEAAENGNVVKQVKIVDPTKDEDESDDESDSDFNAEKIKTSDESDSDTGSEESKGDEESESDEETPAKKVDQGKNNNGTNQVASTDSEDSDSESDEETPAERGTNTKRKSEARSPTPVVTKKAKNATPEMLDGRRVVHLATPYPSKKSGKTPQNGVKNQNQTPNSNRAGTSKNGQQNKKSKQGRQ